MTVRTAVAAALALLTMTGLCACATTAAPGSSSALPNGRTFLSTAVTENGAPKQLVAGTRIQLRFEDPGVVANAGCNTMSGPASVQNGALVVDENELAMTLMGCLTAGLSEQDTWLSTFVTGRPALRLDGDQLTLSGSAVTITLLDRQVIDPDRPLIGTRWSVDTIFNGDVASSVSSDTPAVLVVDAGGTFTATTGCADGQLQGTASVQGSTVTFTVTNQQPCTKGSIAMDAAVRSVLSGKVGYVISAGSLRLTAGDGSGLGLHAAAA